MAAAPCSTALAFEVMLVASYGLLLLGGELPQLREGFKYVVINVVASAVFVITAGMTYGLVGSLNLADIAQRVAAHGPDPRLTVLAALLALVFATKAAVFPLGFWLPNSYPVPPAAISAFFAAVLTKVGVYALVRTFTLMFPGEQLLPAVLLALGGVSMVVGALGAIARRRWRHAMAFANVASIGYLVAGSSYCSWWPAGPSGWVAPATASTATSGSTPGWGPGTSRRRWR
ncbi:MAG: proton-conducting transporter membrane subunit [Deinococcales bacterium]